MAARENYPWFILFLIYRYFCIIEMKRLYTFYTKGAKRPSPVYCPITVINLKSNYHIIEVYLSYLNITTVVCLDLTTQLSVVCVISIILFVYHFARISDQF